MQHLVRITNTSDWANLLISGPGEWGRMQLAKKIEPSAGARFVQTEPKRLHLNDGWEIEIIVDSSSPDLQIEVCKGEIGQIIVSTSKDTVTNNMHKGEFGDRDKYCTNANLKL